MHIIWLVLHVVSFAIGHAQLLLYIVRICDYYINYKIFPYLIVH